MRILVGCEESQIITEAFLAIGHDAMSCDLKPGAKGLPHYRGDVRDLFNEHFDLFIVHPPCTRLTNSGVRWLAERNLWHELEQGAEFFLQCLNAPFPRIAVENPIMHKHARKLVNVKYSQIIQPWQFGHGETKATCLWLKGLPNLKPTQIVPGREHRVHKMPGGKNQSANRSRSYEGIARAMASQWGAHLTQHAPDVWYAPVQMALFVPEVLSTSQALSQPTSRR
jgi:hypothetical protein